MYAAKQSASKIKQMKSNGFIKFLVKYKYLNLMALPCLIYFIMFHYIPMAGIVIAFKNYRGTVSGFEGIFAAPWVGLENFKMFFDSIYFGRLLGNTLLISIYRLVFSFPVPIIFSLLLNELQGKHFKRVVQTVSYLPHFLSWVVISGLMVTLLSPDAGPLNAILKMLGKEPIFFLANDSYFRPILVISGIWQSVGWSSIVYLATISSLPTEQYESASLEGANRFQRIWYITLPGMKDIIAIFLILDIGKIMNENFEQIYNLYSPAVYQVADVFETYVYRMGIGEAKFSYSAAVGLFKSFSSLILVGMSNFVAKRMGAEGIW